MNRRLGDRSRCYRRRLFHHWTHDLAHTEDPLARRCLRNPRRDSRGGRLGRRLKLLADAPDGGIIQ